MSAKTAERWSLGSLREKLVKIGAKVVSHGRYVTFKWPRSRYRRRCSEMTSTGIVSGWRIFAPSVTASPCHLRSTVTAHSLTGCS